jgi:hypothetical protein
MARMSIRPAATVVVARPGSTPVSPVEILTLRRSTLVPVRFDATFFAVAAVRGLTATPDGVEIERVWWATPETVLGEASAGDVLLMWPTLRTLQALSECGTVEDVLALRVEAGPPPRAAP